MQEFGLDEYCDYSYSISDEAAAALESFYESEGACNATKIVLDTCWEDSTICDIYEVL